MQTMTASCSIPVELLPLTSKQHFRHAQFLCSGTRKAVRNQGRSRI